MSMNIQEEITEELRSKDPITVAGALITIGKKGLDEFRQDVLHLINHEDADIRTQALRVMTFYWKEPDFEQVAFSAITDDPDPDCREHALSYWATYYKGTADKRALGILARLSIDRTQPLAFRAVAVRQFFRVRFALVYTGEYSEALGDALYSASSEAEFKALLPMKQIQPYL
jgi:hypothetical protein